MTEYQLIDVLNSTLAQAWTISQYGLSIQTGYLLIAYFIGRKLTLFQVSFVNFTFLLMSALVIASLREVSLRVQQMIASLSDASAYFSNYAGLSRFNPDEITAWPVYLAGGVLTAGCLIFMWTMRHGDPLEQ